MTEPIRYRVWSADAEHTFNYNVSSLDAARLGESVLNRYARYLEDEGLRSAALLTTGIETDDGDDTLDPQDWVEVGEDAREKSVPADVTDATLPVVLRVDSKLPVSLAFGTPSLVLHFKDDADRATAERVLAAFHETLFAEANMSDRPVFEHA